MYTFNRLRHKQRMSEGDFKYVNILFIRNKWCEERKGYFSSGKYKEKWTIGQAELKSWWITGVKGKGLLQGQTLSIAL